jgi:dienelactone hydrolase
MAAVTFRFSANFVLALLFLCCAALMSRPVQSQVARLELHSFQTQTPTDQEFLSGKRDAKPATIAGELRIPRPGTERLPAVVLLHGSGGAGGLEDQWAREFNAHGIATFIVDSFTGRGIVNTFNDQDQLSRLAAVGDAYRALETLSKHPRIDSGRVMLMGFSRGGGAAHWAALKRFQAMHGPSGALSFAGYVAMYPTCNRVFIDGLDVVNKPIRIFHGKADDYNPIAECRYYVDRLQKAGKDISLIEYADANHVFDNMALKFPLKLAQAQTTRGCPLIDEAADGRLVDSQTKQAFTYATDACVQRGVTIGYNAQAHAEAVKAINEFAATLFQSK